MQLKNHLRWYVLYTRFKFERRVEKQLLKVGIEAYEPLRTIPKQRSDRVKKIQEPLFQNNVFVKGDLKGLS